MNFIALYFVRENTVKTFIEIVLIKFFFQVLALGITIGRLDMNWMDHTCRSICFRE